MQNVSAKRQKVERLLNWGAKVGYYGDSSDGLGSN